MIETAPGMNSGTTVDGGSVSRRSANAKSTACAKQAHLCRFGHCPAPESEARRNPLPLGTVPPALPQSVFSPPGGLSDTNSAKSIPQVRSSGFGGLIFQAAHRLEHSIVAKRVQLAETKRTASAMTSLSGSPVSLRRRTKPLVPLANFSARPIRTHRAEFLF